MAQSREEGHRRWEQCARSDCDKGRWVNASEPGSEPHFCSVSCSKRRQTPLPLCPVCGIASVKEKRTNFCSKACRAASKVGSRVSNGDGYWMVYHPGHPMAGPNNYVPEHRYVMAESLGRVLDAEEIVHHINHDPTDNRLENLQLTTRAEHRRLHRKGAQ